MKAFILIIGFIILFCTLSPAEVNVYLAPQYAKPGEFISLSLESLADINFPKPLHNQPVLFIHDHESGSGNKSFMDNWQQPLDGLTSFQHTLDLPQNAHLDIEPYTIDLEDYDNETEKINRSLEEDARKIKEAVNLILLHQGDPGAVSKKVAIIAYGKGAISARLYLKNLWLDQNKSFAFLPVSELIAISPPNHGLKGIKEWGMDCLSLRQLANGFDENCKPYDDPRCLHFMERLNGHPMRDSMKTNYCASIFDSEAPGCRRNNEPPDKGILYVTLYAHGNTSLTGGDTPSDDCQGRVLAKNLAPLAENREMNYFLSDDPMESHRRIVHDSSIICQALYSAAYHQAPPHDMEIEYSQPGNPASPPIIPAKQAPRQETGVVLLFDISQSMTPTLPPVQKAVDPFIRLFSHYWDGKANLGIAVFPALPWSCQPQKEGCTQTIDTMTMLTASAAEHAVKTVNCLAAQGYTPLLKGIDTALEMFGQEKNKSIILISDGHHNYPTHVRAGDDAVKKRCTALEENRAALYTIGIGSPLGVNHPLPQPPASERTADRTDGAARKPGDFFQVMIPGIPKTGTPTKLTGSGSQPNPDLEDALHQALQTMVSRVLNLAEGETVTGKIKTGETAAVSPRIAEGTRKLSFLLTWKTPGAKRLYLAIEAPGGGSPANHEAVKVSAGETFQLVTVSEEFLKQPGRGGTGTQPWRVRIESPGMAAGEEETYRFSVLMDTPVRLAAGFDRSGCESGEPITVFAEITKEGRPVTGLSEVFVTVTPPVEGVGNWYARHKISARELESVPVSDGEETMTLLERKAYYLVEKRGEVFPGILQGNPAPAMQLYDDGSHGDITPGDGIYTNRFNETFIEGAYTFRFRAVGETFTLEQVRQKYVAVKPLPEKSPLDIQWYDTSTDDPVQYLYNIVLVPKDAIGNFLGPGHNVEVNVVYSQNRDSAANAQRTVTFPLRDNLEGTYSGTAAVLPSALKQGVRLEFRIDGRVFTTIAKIPAHKNKALGFTAGIGSPGFAYGRTRGSGINFGAQVEYRFSPQFSLLGMAGYNRFSSTAPGGNNANNDNTSSLWWNLSANLKSEIGKSRFRVFINVGPGVYISKEGEIETGFNFGLGATYSLNSGWGMELGTNFHHVFTGELPDPNFFASYVRFLYRF